MIAIAIATLLLLDFEWVLYLFVIYSDVKLSLSLCGNRSVADPGFPGGGRHARRGGH